MLATLPTGPVPIVEQIPRPEAIVRRLGETAAERRLLRALLKVARMRERQGALGPAGGEAPATNARPVRATQ